MSVRAQLAADLVEGLPDTYRVIPYPTRDPGQVSKPTVMAYQTTLTRQTVGPIATARWEAGVQVWVLVTDSQDSTTEDALETALWEVLAVLDPLRYLAVSTITRTHFQDRLPAYQIVGTVTAGPETTDTPED